MNAAPEPTATPAETPASDRRFIIGFALGFALMIVLNLASYFWLSFPEVPKFKLPASHRIGFPKPFWVEDPYYMNRLPGGSKQPPAKPEFSWVNFLIDLGLAGGMALSLGQWLQKRGQPAPVLAT